MRTPLRLYFAVLLASLCIVSFPGGAASSALLGWNNLGMHCMDSDYSVFSILPPYNTIEAQLIVNGRLVTNGSGYSVTYQAVADPTGSFNSTAMGKGNFYSFAAALYGATLPPEMGLAGWAMPGSNNIPQAMLFERTNHPAAGVATPANWFRAEGIPIAPYDDAHRKNPYPLLRLDARDAGGSVIATTAIVLPVSDEMDCRVCHASGAPAAAEPAAGWVYDSNPERDYRLNILRLHDETEFARHPDLYTAALAARGFNANGLYTNVITDGRPILCATCHASEALGTPSYGTIPPLTASVHSWHAAVLDPVLNVTLDSSANRSACYRCHPGSATRCLRGAMGSATASDGSMAMQCQSCHGNMTRVGSTNRVGWFMEPNCQSCHTGTASHNNGLIRYTSAFEPGGAVRVAVDQTFATTPNTPASGLSLYRFSVGHGGLQCSSCHGSTHAEFPSSHANDNLRNIQLQGHAGVMAECTACHASTPNTVSGGPHGMHPTGQAWVNQHHDAFEDGAASRSQCQACHGVDYRGTVLSRAQADRQFVAFGGGTANTQFFRGAIVGCYNCHNGPNSESMNRNPAPTVNNISARTAVDAPVTFALPASGANLTLRIISQPVHGSAGLSGTLATYFPEAGFSGVDSFTFAAYDGAKNSRLATATIGVGVAVDLTPPTVQITSPTTGPTWSASGPTVSLGGTAADESGIAGVTWANDRGGSGAATGTTAWTAAGIPLQSGVNIITITARDGANNLGTHTLTVTYTSATLAISIAGSGTVSPDLTGQALQLGRSYTLRAKPSSGYIFANWTGSILASTPSLTFVLASNTVLQANFIPNPFIPVKGTWNGLFRESGEHAQRSSGAFTISVTTSGKFSGSLQGGGNRYSLHGQFDDHGRATISVLRSSMPPLTITLQLDLTGGTDHLTGSVTDGTWTADLAADRAIFDGKTQIAPQAGQYTLIFPGDDDSAAEPGGAGYATVSVSTSGQIRLSGALADGTKISQQTTVSRNGDWPLYIATYSKQGSLQGWLHLVTTDASDLHGEVTWLKPALPGALYPAGFNLDTEAAGYRYTRPAPGTRVLSFSQGRLTLTGGGLAAPIIRDVSIDANNHVTSSGPNKLSLTISVANGSFSGSLSDPALAKAVKFNGVLLQRPDAGAGYFLGATQSGQVILTAAP